MQPPNTEYLARQREVQPNTQAHVYRIRDGVAKLTRQGTTLLIAPEDGRSARISRIGEELLPLLGTGARFDDLVIHLRASHPTAADIPTKLRSFLDQLARTGLLDSEQSRSPPRRAGARFPLLDIDPAAAWLAAGVRWLPHFVSWSALALALAAALGGVASLAYNGEVPHPSTLVTGFSAWGLCIFVFLVVPVHEAAHALACRLAGAQVGKAGIILHGWLIPGPYVDTSHAYKIAQKWKRFCIPAAGPFVDLLAVGAAAWFLVLQPGSGSASQIVAGYVFLLAAIFFFLDTNPLAPSDGSRMLEAALGDELARRSALSRTRARLSEWKTVAWYRAITSLHLQSSALLAYVWWRS